MITGAKLSIIRCVLGKRIAYRAGLTPLMKSNIKPYAQSLRAIGQALECLRINTFALQKKDERYIVRNWEPSFLKNITMKVWGTVGSDQLSFTAQESKDTLLYSSSDTKRLKAYGRSRRGSKDNQNTYNISLGLRLVGDYLDRKGAVAFSIWWSIESVKVRYEAAAGSEEEVSFTVQNLRDLGAGMYLRRSGRQLTI